MTFKVLKKKVAKAKELLIESAALGEWKEKAGENAECIIGQTTKSTPGTATEFAKLLKAEGKIKLFDDMVKVQVGEAKKYLGEDALKDFVVSEVKEYGSVKLKKL